MIVGISTISVSSRSLIKQQMVYRVFMSYLFYHSKNWLVVGKSLRDRFYCFFIEKQILFHYLKRQQSLQTIPLEKDINWLCIKNVSLYIRKLIEKVLWTNSPKFKFILTFFPEGTNRIWERQVTFGRWQVMLTDDIWWVTFDRMHVKIIKVFLHH